MDSIRIQGGTPLKGTINISGAKNAALPLMTASLLTDKPLVLENLPDLADINTMAQLLEKLGTQFSVAQNGIRQRKGTLTTSTVSSVMAPYDLVRKMRASILVLGPLVARAGKAAVSLPGGCALGTRAVDLHIAGLQKMGAQIDLANGYIVAEAPKGLTGAEIVFPQVTVTGTENLMMAACLAKGDTTLVGAAKEPEVTDLAECLVKMGAKIEGIGTDTLRITGKTSLGGATHRIVADRIEAGTYAVAAAITHGELELTGARAEHLQSFIEFLSRAGVSTTQTPNGIKVKCDGNVIKSADVKTEPYPGFATDLQAQAMALMCLGDGASSIHETIFENRFMHVPELVRMGANITVTDRTAFVRGVPELRGAQVMATDLRASVCLVLAGLAAKGETQVNRVYHLDRGYEHVEEKLKACGAHVERVKEAA
jgi:UDP-N-acetylglucosamine 1-carboxyvinyltransferase